MSLTAGVGSQYLAGAAGGKSKPDARLYIAVSANSRESTRCWEE
jgi:hypothetical protein